MSEKIRVSGKKVALPTKENGWKFETRPGGWVIATRENEAGGSERRRFMVQESKGNFSFSISGLNYHAKIEAESRGGGSAGSDADLIAQFPGKVRKILAKEGQTVKESEPLLLLEAMKMEFSVKAPFEGVVKKIHVTEGQQLTPGTRFLDLTPTQAKGEAKK